MKKFIATLCTAVILVVTIFVSTQIPLAKTDYKNLEVVIVNEDAGDLGKNIVEKLKENSQDKFKLVELESKDSLINAMNDENYYGGLVIPADFSAKVAKIPAGEMEQLTLDIVINEGNNIQIANQMTSTLTMMANTLGDGIATQILLGLKANNVPVKAELALFLQNPVKVNVEKINVVNNFTTGAVVFFQPVWIVSLATAVLMFFNYRKQNFADRREEVKYKVNTSLLALVVSVFVGFFTPWLMEAMLGLEVSNYTTLATFLAIATYAFITLVYGALNWLGLPAMSIFALLIFYGLPLIQLPSELLPSFYADWVYPWLPMKFLLDGIKSILFFGADVWNNSTNSLIVIFVIGLVLLFTKFSKNEIKDK